MGKLIEKYKVSEKDIYIICFIKNKKLGFSKTIQIKNLILKPYKVKFLEQAPLEKEITDTKSHENEELFKKYGEIDLSKFEQKLKNQKGSKSSGLIVFGLVFFFFLWMFGVFGGGGGVDEDCLIGYDWCYPNCNNATGAWKFNSDNSFNYSSTMFGGMYNTGTWTMNEDGNININGRNGSQTLEMPDCNTLKVGSTLYEKE